MLKMLSLYEERSSQETKSLLVRLRRVRGGISPTSESYLKDKCDRNL